MFWEGLCDNGKSYISIAINNKIYFISIMKLCHKKVLQVIVFKPSCLEGAKFWCDIDLDLSVYCICCFVHT